MVKDADGKVVYYTEGAMKGKPKKKVTYLRKKESLPFYLIAKPTSPMERQQNREILEMVEKIRFEKEQELKEQHTGLRLAKHPEEINFFDYFQSFIDNYTKKDADCGGEYYYSWEDAFIFQKELPSLYEAVNTIKSNLNRATDHNEKYAYTTKDNVVIFAENPGKGWTLKLSVDVHKSNSHISLTPTELDNFVQLLRQANKKLDEIK